MIRGTKQQNKARRKAQKARAQEAKQRTLYVASPICSKADSRHYSAMIKARARAVYWESLLRDYGPVLI